MENDNLGPEFQDDQVLHEHFSFTADPGQEPLRVDKYLMNRGLKGYGTDVIVDS